jgi:hypothetical protein
VAPVVRSQAFRRGLTCYLRGFLRGAAELPSSPRALQPACERFLPEITIFPRACDNLYVATACNVFTKAITRGSERSKSN